MQVDRLQKRWQDGERFRPFVDVMDLGPDGLVLGRGTILCGTERDRVRRRMLRLEGHEPRLLTLLSVAYGRPVRTSVLRHIAKASERWSHGEDCQAALHLAFARLPKLEDSDEAAERLFIADELIESGVAVEDVLIAFGLEAVPLAGLQKLYDEEEARIPAGSGRESGRWSTVGAALRSVLAAVSEEQKLALASFAARFAVPVLALGAMFFPNRAGGRTQEGEIEGAPGLRYAWNEDETALRLTYATGKTVLMADHGQDGLFRDDRQRVIGRALDGQVILDAAAIRAELPQNSDDDEEQNSVPRPVRTRRAGPRRGAKRTRTTRITSSAS